MHTGAFNQAGDLAPTTGPYGVAFKQSAVGVMVEDLPYRHPYGGWVGAIVPVGVLDAAVVPGMAYGGSTPAMLQPVIVRPDPWNS